MKTFKYLMDVWIIINSKSIDAGVDWRTMYSWFSGHPHDLHDPTGKSRDTAIVKPCLVIAIARGRLD